MPNRIRISPSFLFDLSIFERQKSFYHNAAYSVEHTGNSLSAWWLCGHVCMWETCLDDLGVRGIFNNNSLENHKICYMWDLERPKFSTPIIRVRGFEDHFIAVELYNNIEYSARSSLSSKKHQSARVLSWRKY